MHLFVDAPAWQLAANGVSGAGDFVGGRRPDQWPALSAPWHCSASGTFSELPRRTTDRAEGAGCALSEDGNWAVGYILSTAWKYVPTRWQRLANGTWTLPGGNLTCADPNHSGYAFGVNNAGVVVGRLQMPVGVSRAFRVPNGAPVDGSEFMHGLLPPAASIGAPEDGPFPGERH